MQPDGVCRVWTTKQIFRVQRSCRTSLDLLAPVSFCSSVPQAWLVECRPEDLRTSDEAGRSSSECLRETSRKTTIGQINRERPNPMWSNGMNAYSYHPNLFPWWGGGTALSADFNNTKPAGLQRLGHYAIAANTQSARWSWGDRAPMLVEGPRLGSPFDLFKRPKSRFSYLSVLVFICFIFVPNIQAKENVFAQQHCCISECVWIFVRCQIRDVVLWRLWVDPW